jgi:hypothetical protein
MYYTFSTCINPNSNGVFLPKIFTITSNLRFFFNFQQYQETKGPSTTLIVSPLKGIERVSAFTANSILT